MWTSTSDGSSKLNFVRGHGTRERLHIGVDRDDVRLAHTIEDNPVEDVQPGAANTDDLEGNFVLGRFVGQVVVAVKLDHGRADSGFALAVTSASR